jgi:hypothetical protein
MNHLRHAIAAAAALAALAAAAHENPATDAKARYEKERAACIGGASHQDQATCLREAAAAYAEARRGQLDAGDAAPDYRRNAMLRCLPLPNDQRKDCEARMRGEGTVRGSVEEGGIYRETVTVEVGQPNR